MRKSIEVFLALFPGIFLWTLILAMLGWVWGA